VARLGRRSDRCDAKRIRAIQKLRIADTG
jgi:hypothetical protein